MFLIFLIVGSTSAFGQNPVIKGTGILYWANIPTVDATLPSGSEWGYVLANKSLYYFDRDSSNWLQYRTPSRVFEIANVSDTSSVRDFKEGSMFVTPSGALGIRAKTRWKVLQSSASNSLYVGSGDVPPGTVANVLTDLTFSGSGAIVQLVSGVLNLQGTSVNIVGPTYVGDIAAPSGDSVLVGANSLGRLIEIPFSYFPSFNYVDSIANTISGLDTAYIDNDTLYLETPTETFALLLPGTIVTTAPDTASVVIYKPAHGFNPTSCPGKILPLTEGFDAATSANAESLPFTYAVGTRGVDSLVIKFSGFFTSPSHGLTVGQVYYQQNTSCNLGLSPGTIAAPVLLVIDANTIQLIDRSGIPGSDAVRIWIPSSQFTSRGDSPTAPRDSTVGAIALQYQTAGLARPGAIFVYQLAAGTNNPTHTALSSESSSPMRAWFWDGTRATRITDATIAVDMTATAVGTRTLIPATNGTEAEAISYITNNYANLNIPNGTFLYWKGAGTDTNPDTAYVVLDNPTIIGGQEVLLIKSLGSGTGSGLDTFYRSGDNLIIIAGIDTFTVSAPNENLANTNLIATGNRVFDTDGYSLEFNGGTLTFDSGQGGEIQITDNVNITADDLAGAGIINATARENIVLTAESTDIRNRTTSLPSEIHLREAAVNGVNYVGLKPPTSLAADIIFQLMGADGTPGQAIVTDGSRNLSFATVGGGSGLDTFYRAGDSLYIVAGADTFHVSAIEPDSAVYSTLTTLADSVDAVESRGFYAADGTISGNRTVLGPGRKLSLQMDSVLIKNARVRFMLGTGITETAWSRTFLSGIDRIIRIPSGGYGSFIEEISSVYLDGGFGGYSGIYSTAYGYSPTPITPASDAYIASYFAIPIYHNTGGGALRYMYGYNSSMNSAENSPVTGGYDFYASEINDVNRVTGTPNMTTHFGFFAENFTKATNNYGVFISGTQSNYFSGQVGIGTFNVGNGLSNPHASAKLEVRSSTQGFLPPRMTANGVLAISSPAEGLLAYATDANGGITSKGWWGYDGSSWIKINNTGGGSGTVTSVATGYGLSGGPITTTGTISADSTKLATLYALIDTAANIRADMGGGGGGGVTDGDKGDIDVSSGGTVWTIDTSAVTAIKIANDAVTSAKIGTGQVGSDELASTAVTAGTYTNASLTVDADGRLTAASSGTAPVTGTGASGQVAYWTSSTTQTGNNNLFWDATNNRLNINRTGGTQALDMVGRIALGLSSTDQVTIEKVTDGNGKIFRIDNPGSSGGFGSGFVFRGGTNGTAGTVNTFRIYCASTTVPGSTYFGNVTDAGAQAANATTNVGILNKITSTTAYDAAFNVNPNAVTLDYSLTNNKQLGIAITGNNTSTFAPFTQTSTYGVFVGFQYQPLTTGYGSSMVLSGKNDSGVATEIMRLQGKDGNVGIGITNALYRLDITGTGIRGPVRNTASRPTGASGVLGYNSTWNGWDMHNGTAWRRIVDVPDADPSTGHSPVFSSGAWTTGATGIYGGSGSIANNTAGTLVANGFFRFVGANGTEVISMKDGTTAGLGSVALYSTRLAYVYGGDSTALWGARVQVKNPTASLAGLLELHEARNNGTNSAKIQAPANLAADYTLTTPPDDGGDRDVLMTDGSGVTNWKTNPRAEISATATRHYTLTSAATNYTIDTLSSAFLTEFTYSAGVLTYTGTATRRFLINYSLSIATDDSVLLSAGIDKNGAGPLTSTRQAASIGTTTGHAATANISGSGIVGLATSDTVKIVIQSDGAGAPIAIVRFASLTLTPID